MQSRLNGVGLILLLGLLAWTALASSGVLGQERIVRVAVILEKPEFTLTVRGSYEIRDAKTQEVLYESRSLYDAKVVVLGGQTLVGLKKFSSSNLRVSPRRDASILINKCRLRGDIDIIRGDQGTLTVVNAVDLEDYVKGVLYHEVSHRWPLEAIKAQAVATRTYAVYRMKTAGKNSVYDVTSDIYSQVYGGRTSEKYRTTVATNRTKGMVMVYGSQLLPAYFHATCGGHTEDASELWKHEMLPLKGVPCLYCRNSPHYSWKKNFRSKDVQDKLNKNGYDLGLIEEIQIAERNVSGRIRTLKLIMRDGRQETISGKDFRQSVGPNDIRSNNYDIEMKGYYFDLAGKGWGHGVGLCQWGAAEMARRRKNFDEILKYYYPSVDIVDIKEID